MTVIQPLVVTNVSQPLLQPTKENAATPPLKVYLLWIKLLFFSQFCRYNYVCLWVALPWQPNNNALLTSETNGRSRDLGIVCNVITMKGLATLVNRTASYCDLWSDLRPLKLNYYCLQWSTIIARAMQNKVIISNNAN